MATRDVDPTTALLALVQEIVDRYGQPLPLADRAGVCGWCGTRGHSPQCLVDRLTTALFHVRAEQKTRSLDAVVQP